MLTSIWRDPSIRYGGIKAPLTVIYGIEAAKRDLVHIIKIFQEEHQI